MREWQQVWKAGSYGEQAVRRRRAAYKLHLLKSVGLSIAANHRVLEVGCGEGSFAWLVATRTDATVTAIDASSVAVARARSHSAHLKVTYRQEHFGHAPASATAVAGAFDFVVMLGVLEHVPDPRTLLSEAVSVLAPNGLVVLVWSHVWSPFTFERVARRAMGRWPYGRQREMSSRALSRLLSSVGLAATSLRTAPHEPAQAYDRVARLDVALNRASRRIGRYLIVTAGRAGHQPVDHIPGNSG